jgi:DNA-binding NarL/FixJ family response regulator
MARRITSPVIVGRTLELDQLSEALDGVAIGQPGVVVLTGEAGVGKTRLLTEFLVRARSAGSIVTGGACVPLAAGGLPYHPLSQALRGLEPQLDPDSRAWLDEPTRRELRALFPGRHEAAPRPDANSVTRLFDALADFIERVAKDRLLTISIEDLQWADRSTLLLLSFLVRARAKCRLLVAVTVRTDGAPLRMDLIEFLTEIRRARRMDHLELQRLSRTETAELVAAIADRPLPALVDTIYARSDGNPFFVEELLAGRSDARLSQSLRDVAMAQVAALSDPAQQIVRVASVAGRSVDHDLLLRVASSEEMGPGGLREALRHHVLTLEPDTDRYGFRHALVREAVYDDLLPAERKRLHRAYARALSIRAGGASPYPTAAASAELAYHWDRAGDGESAFVGYVEAARAAEASYAHHEALRHYLRALELGDAPGGVQPTPSLLQEASDTARLAGDPECAVDLVRRALEEMGPDAEPLARGLALGQLAHGLWETTRSDEALQAIESAVVVVTDLPPSQGKARVFADHGRLLMLSEMPKESIVRNRQALVLARQANATAEAADASISLGVSLAESEDYEEGLAILRQGAEMAEELGDVYLTSRAVMNLAAVLGEAGLYREALAICTSGLEKARQMGASRYLRWMVTVNMVESLSHLGRFDEAVQLARDTKEQSMIPLIDTYLSASLVAIATERGDASLAAEALADLPPLEPAATPALGSPAEYLEVQVATLQGRWDAVRDAASRALRLPIPIQILPDICVHGIRAEAEMAAQARHRRDDSAIAECDRYATEFYDAMTSQALPAKFPRLVVDAQWALGAAHLTRVRGRSDPEAWRQAVHACEASESPHWLAAACYRLAEALLGAGDSRTEAASALQRALAGARELGIKPLVGAVENLVRRARLDREDATAERGPATSLGLTRRELEVLRLIAAGLANREIAARLFVSERTVATHISNILGKLGAANRVEAVAIAGRAIENLAELPSPS